ncbi:hypothetical protein ACFYVL_34965 [Streptomyces sp. NPDC004111]|uniref:hypothetical protein n=1 Tax=Streptomyces sp. NPDC004111 TaxID=3364690 RepID=UPI0036A75B41
MLRTTRLTRWCGPAALLAVVLGMLCGPAAAAPVAALSGAGASAASVPVAASSGSASVPAVASSASASVPAVAHSAAVSVPVAASSAGVSTPAEDPSGPARAGFGPVDAPGCDRAPAHPDGTHPSTPPRTGTPYDLLPVLCDGDRSAAVGRYLDAALSCAPRRGPPTPLPPSPVELSVLLRV